MSFLDLLFGKKGGKARKSGGSGRHESALYVSVSDGGWSAALAEGSTIRWQKKGWSALSASDAAPAQLLTEAVAQLEAEQPQANVTSVVLTIDDPDMHIVDHRFAKLTNFEPRALKDFGSQQAGGRQVAFSSLPFGVSSAREIERRVLSFLPEDRLQNLFFPLGKMAPSLIAVVPASTRILFGEHPGIFATLRVHGYFSTLTIANGENGLIAERQLSFGALSLAQAYGNAHGLSLEDGIAALNARTRLPAAVAVKGTPDPEHQTATFAALAPVLRSLIEDVAASISYFRFERLAGRPANLGLTFTGAPIAGFDSWLAEALELQVDLSEDSPAAMAASQTQGLNLLEQSRSGLLKMGNQPYEFARGRFVAMKVKGAQSQMTRTAKPKLVTQLSAQLVAQFPQLGKLSLFSGGADFSISREKLMLGGGVFAVLAFLIVFNLWFLTGPAGQRMAEEAATYTGLSRQTLAASAAAASKTEAPKGGQAALWADDLLSVSKALVPGMKLQSLRLGAADNSGPQGGLSLMISGALPSGSAANLKLVAVFIDRLGKDEIFARRFKQINFAGAGESTDQNKPEMLFNVAAAPAGAKK